MVLSLVGKYLDMLPNGAASYPECCVKASVLRHGLAAKPLGRETDLPPTIRSLVDHPPPVTEWIPEVHLNVIMLAIREVHFEARNLDSYLTWTLEQNRKLLGTPLYRVLFFVMSPDRLLNGLEKRWSAFRRGTDLRVIDRAVGQAELLLQHPAFLYSSQISQAMAMALQAAMEQAGAKQAHVDVASPTSTETVISARWQ